MSGLEDRFFSLLKTVNELVDKNEWLEGEVLKGQEEILFLKRAKLQTDRKLDKSITELSVLKATRSALPVPNVDVESMRNKELTSIKQDVRDMKDDIEKIKKQLRSLSSPVDSKEDLGTIQDEAQLTFSVNQQQQQQPQCHSQHQQERDEHLQHQQLIPQQIQLHQQRQQQNEQLQQISPSPTQEPSASMLLHRQDSETTSMIQELRDELLKDSTFHVSNPHNRMILQTKNATRMERYGKVNQNKYSQYMDKRSGAYQTPIRGMYQFGGVMVQEGHGRLDWYLCENGEKRRELLIKTDRDGTWSSKRVCWECGDNVEVWVEVVRIEGEAKVRDFQFFGQLFE